MTESDASY